MPHGCGHGPDNGSADCGHDGDSGWGWSGGEATRDSTHHITIRPKHPDSDFYFMLVVAVGVLGFLAWILSPIYM